MRIIAGQWRGRTIAGPAGQATRPTADRARETLFSMLASRMGGFTGLRVADLFAGSGALGFEALSRGAAHCLFADSDRSAIDAIRRNAATLGAAGAEVLLGDATQLSPPANPFDLVMIDPPYAYDGGGVLLTTLASHGWLGADSWLSYENAGTAPQTDGLECVVSRRAGKAWLHLYRLPS